jgi:uncharacterized protein YndB with AHSA1/START domain
MRHVHAEIRVDAPVGHVFDLACNPERQPEWNPYLRLEDVNGPIDHVGTSFASTLSLAGQHVHSLGVITEVVPNRLIRIHGAATSGGTSEWVYRFVPEGEATQCSLDIEYEAPGVIHGVLDALVYHGALERAARHIAENFAAVAEATVPVLA